MTSKTVYQCAINRLDIIFNNFDNIYVSFSGGKDSGVLLNLCIDYIRKNNINRKIGVFHLDYEAQYTATTKYVDEVLSNNQDILEVYRCCVPFKVTTCTSMHQMFWRPWDNDLQELWVSKLPDKCYQAKDFDFYTPEIWDYEFQEKFSSWFHKKNNATKTCCLVGIRTQESLNRWRAIHSDRNYRNFDGHIWTKEMYKNVYNAYPIYDWITEDIWTANAKFNWSYNKLYDLFYLAGISIDKMRVASPFLSSAQDSLRLYQIIEPDTWGKLIGRVNGVNFTGIYGGTTAMGWKSIKLPNGYNWESYMYFLLNTLPENIKKNYLEKLEISKKFWHTRGGCLSNETIKKLRDRNIKIEVVSSTNFKTDKLPVKMEYLDDIDIPEFQQIPSYKRMCICIIKNDHLCKYMGFGLSKKELTLREETLKKYNNI
jgi:predicted phosphoadenosine phosphosulfate sulfurtransferase